MKQLLFIALITCAPYLHPSRRISVHHAASEGNVANLERLLERDPASLEKKTAGLGRTPLHSAIIGLQPETVAYLLGKNADVRATDKHGQDVFCILTHYGNIKLTEADELKNYTQRRAAKKKIEDTIATIRTLLIQAGAHN